MNCIWRRLPLEVGDALGFGNRFEQAVGRPSLSISPCAGSAVARRATEVLAVFLEIGPAAVDVTAQLALEFEVEPAAFGNEMAFDVIALVGLRDMPRGS